MWQSTYSYDDSQTSASGSQSSGYSGYDGQCGTDGFQPHSDHPQQPHSDYPQQPQNDFPPQDDFQPDGFSFGEHYQTQEFHYHHSEHHVDSSAFYA
jgi:hypothetical protein